MKPVKWPGKAYDSDAGDLAVPINNLLENLRDIGKPDAPDDGGKDGKVSLMGGTPYSLQVINAGASSLSKLWIGAVAAFGGAGAITTGIAAFWDAQEGSVRVAAIAALAVILASAFIAIAIIVQSDVQARAIATAARRSAASDVVAAMLNNSRSGVPVPAPVFSANYAIKRSGSSDWVAVEGFSWDKQGLKAKLTGQPGTVDASAIDDMVDLREVLKGIDGPSGCCPRSS